MDQGIDIVIYTVYITILFLINCPARYKSCLTARKFLRKHTADVHDDMFPKWLGPFFIALYIIIDSSLVLDGKITLGTWANSWQAVGVYILYICIP